MLWRRCSMPMSAGSKRCKNKNGHYIFQRLESEAQANMQKEQHVARYHQSLCRSSRRTIQTESTFASSQNSRFLTGTRTQGAGVDHRLMGQLFGPWRSPSQILNETFLQIWMWDHNQPFYCAGGECWWLGRTGKLRHWPRFWQIWNGEMLAVLSTIVCLFEYELYHLRFGQVLALTWSGSHPTGDKEGESVRAATNFGNTAFLWIISRILRGHWEDISGIATYLQVWLVGRVLQWRLLLEQDGVRLLFVILPALFIITQ